MSEIKEMAPGRNYHLRISIRGLLRLDRRAFHESWHGAFKNDDGTVLTDFEAIEFLFDELAAGHEFLPAVQCDNWDHEKGCLGHSAANENLPRQTGLNEVSD